ncbi:MAG: hypothetical protein R3C12_18835 [Planctomycetaceae bacterium]
MTPLGSLDNLKQRLLASGQWTIGILPALAGLVFFLAIGQRGRPEWWLPLAAIFSLHLLHLPYWYDGIMHWHYVFESAPLLALIYARGTQLLAWNCRRIGRHWVAAWWLGLPMLGLLTAYTTFEPFWSSTLSAGVGELRFARERHAQFTHWIESQSEAPAVVFIRPDERICISILSSILLCSMRPLRALVAGEILDRGTATPVSRTQPVFGGLGGTAISSLECSSALRVPVA